MELEKHGLVGGRPLPYDGEPASVRGTLVYLRDRRGGDPVYEGDKLIGIEAPWGSITLEPGGQVEWSSQPVPDLDRLDADLRDHLAALSAAGEALGIRWGDRGVLADVPLDAMPWMPKARYGIMRDVLGARGRLVYLTAGERIEAEDLAFILSPTAASGSVVDAGLTLNDATHQFQQRYIAQTIDRARGNVSQAATSLGVHRSNLYRKMRQLGMETGEGDTEDGN